MYKKKKTRILAISILTTITVIVWVVFDVYRSLTFKPPQSVSESTLSPLNPNLNLTTLEEIESRLSVSEEETGRFTSTGASVQTETQSESTPSGQTEEEEGD